MVDARGFGWIVYEIGGSSRLADCIQGVIGRLLLRCDWPIAGVLRALADYFIRPIGRLPSADWRRLSVGCPVNSSSKKVRSSTTMSKRLMQFARTSVTMSIPLMQMDR